MNDKAPAPTPETPATAPAPTPETPATAPVDPFAGIQATPVDKLFVETAGRPVRPIPDSVTALVTQSWNNGTPKTLRVPVTDEKQANDLRKWLEKAGERHDPLLTIRKTVEKADGKVVAVRFQAGPKVSKQAATAPADPATETQTGKPADPAASPAA